MEKPHPSTVAWCTLAASITAYDLFSPEGETLSEAVDRALERPRSKLAAIGGVVLVAAHLINAIPTRFDPIHHFAERAKTAIHDFVESDRLDIDF